MATPSLPLRLLLVCATPVPEWERVVGSLGWNHETVSFESWFAFSALGPFDAALLDPGGPGSADLWLRIHHMVPRVSYPLLVVAEASVPSSFHYPRAGGLRVALLAPGTSPDVLRSTLGLALEVYRRTRPSEAPEAEPHDPARHAERQAVVLESVNRALQELEMLQSLLEPAPEGGLATPSPLGGREQEVYTWLMKGLSAEAIGAHLGIAVSTVKKHIQAVYRKRGVTGRAQLMARGGL